MKQLTVSLLALFMVFLTVSEADAGGRPDNGQDFFAHFALGMMLPQEDFGDVVGDDFYYDGGITYWPEEWPVGLNFDLAYTQTDLKSSVVRAINDQLGPGMGSISGGDASIWSLSTNAMWGPDTDGPLGVYLIGGVGINYLRGRITDDALVYYPPICDPWFWYCYPGGVGPGSIIKLKESATELSWNAGIGVTFDTSSGTQIYLEARYEWLDTDRKTTTYVPLVVGFRW